MAKQERVDVMLPVGRLVNSYLYEPRTTDFDGKPLVFKNGADAGKPRVAYDCSIAITKTPGATHFGNEAWGQQIWNKGHGDFPQGQASSATFAWKITDGDSQVPNAKGNKPCDNPHYKGCWVVHISSSLPPKIVNRDGSAYLLEKDAIKPGYYVQASISVNGNGQLMKPGIYINMNAISLQAFGEEIVFGANPAAMGFGANVALPAGAAAVPVGYGTVAAQPAAPAVPMPAGPGATMPPQPAAVGAPVAAVPNVGASPAPGVPMAAVSAPVAAVPNPGFVAAAITPPAPPVAPVAIVAPGLVMTAQAGGQTAEAFRAAGWTDEQMIANGFAVRG